MTVSVPLRVTVPVAACIGTAASYLLYRKLRKTEIGNSLEDNSFEECGTVKKIFIYPIKSLPPLEIATAEFTVDGLNYRNLRDREFLLVDAKSRKFITARDEPTLLLLKTYYDGADCLQIESENPLVNMETLKIALSDRESTGELLEVTTWQPDNKYETVICQQNLCDWFTQYLERKVFLVRLQSLKSTPRNDIPNRFQDNAAISYLSFSSVKSVNDLIGDPRAKISHRNFRPTILVDTKHPFEEDFWQRVQIGDAETQFLQRCDRCLLTTINPDSGVKIDNQEPLSTLRKFRVERSPEGIAKYKFRPLLATLHFVSRPGSISVDQVIKAKRAERELI